MEQTKRKWRLIAFDLDGTLLDEDKSIPEENLRALEAAAARGALLVPATGRIFKGLPEGLKALPGLRYFILSNGASVYDAAEDRQLYRGEIPLSLALDCYAYLDGLPVLYDCYQNDWGYMSRRMYERAADYLAGEPGILRLVRELRTPVEDLREHLRQKGEPLQKIQLYFLPGDEPERLRQLEEIPRRFPGLKASSSVRCNIELNGVDAGKGRALEALCARLGVPPEDCVAFGDGGNDTELLEAAGLGVAMGNAVPEVKAAADLIAPPNTEAGLGRVLRRLLEGEEEKG